MEAKQIVELSKILKARLSKAIETIDRNLKLLEDCQQVDFYKAEDISQLMKGYSYGVIVRDRVLNSSEIRDELQKFDNVLNQATIRAILQNPNTPIEILQRLTEEDPENFLALAENPAIDLILLEHPEFIENIAIGHLGTYRSGFLEELPLPKFFLELFAKSSNKQIRLKAAKNPNTARDILEFLSRDQENNIRYEVAKNPNTSSNALELLSRDRENNIRYEVAKNLNTSSNVLKLLSRDREIDIRYEVAKNPNTARDILEFLSRDREIDIRYEVAKNLNTPIKILEKLYFAWDEKNVLDYQDCRDRAREKLANNPDTPPEVLDRLSCAPEIYLRLMIANNPNTPKSGLMRLAKNKEEFIRKSVAKNRNTPFTALKSLSRDRFFHVRKTVAENHPTPLSWLTLTKLWFNLPWFELTENNSQCDRSLYLRTFFRYLALAINAFAIILTAILAPPILNLLSFHLRLFPDWIFVFSSFFVILPLPIWTYFYCYMQFSFYDYNLD